MYDGRQWTTAPPAGPVTTQINDDYDNTTTKGEPRRKMMASKTKPPLPNTTLMNPFTNTSHRWTTSIRRRNSWPFRHRPQDRSWPLLFLQKKQMGIADSPTGYLGSWFGKRVGWSFMVRDGKDGETMVQGLSELARGRGCFTLFWWCSWTTFGLVIVVVACWIYPDFAALVIAQSARQLCF